MKTVNSSTSISSLFDRPNITVNTNTSNTTTLTTPIISAVSLNQHFQPDDLYRVNELINHKLNNKTIVLLVGLPACGKSTISKQLANYLQSNNYNSKIYNAGNIRRNQKHNNFTNSDFFNPNNEEAKNERENFATITMNNLLNDLQENKINVGFLDATNTTIERRSRMINLIKESGISANIIVFDIQCNDDRLINFNISGKAFNPDYVGKDYSSSINDFKQRTKHYFKVYEPISSSELSKYSLICCYFKLVNGGKSHQIVYPNTKGLEINHFSNDITTLIGSFVSNYSLLHGDRYFEAVNAFYEK
ncbi:6PF2K-domain-containing protein [Hyphopichia burtonii NRRL Y-1933]|uniref:6PF2K-domain-containing protein n=1 Tax=Hyphopichia burtonii NRRL Y-1933 TaxID=984485 RepID=A0A1E4RPL4_9ASCO|nr:6PF2K-domain-containing protein [Hyphopichia burtonii NRRL Y-1933]ODV69220.1 6PF2K-domain-containing protein [Hyphopichia burtonii NRRL Y-1933]